MHSNDIRHGWARLPPRLGPGYHLGRHGHGYHLGTQVHTTQGNRRGGAGGFGSASFLVQDLTAARQGERDKGKGQRERGTLSASGRGEGYRRRGLRVCAVDPVDPESGSPAQIRRPRRPEVGARPRSGAPGAPKWEPRPDSAGVISRGRNSGPAPGAVISRGRNSGPGPAGPDLAGGRGAHFGADPGAEVGAAPMVRFVSGGW